MRGRLPSGPEYVTKLEGPDEAKRRLEWILRTLAGTARVQEACEQLGISEARFHQLRQEALQAALDGIIARPPGRPPASGSGPAEQQEEVERLRLELKAVQTSEEIALVLPRLARDSEVAAGDESGKKSPRRRQRPRRRRPT